MSGFGGVDGESGREGLKHLPFKAFFFSTCAPRSTAGGPARACTEFVAESPATCAWHDSPGLDALVSRALAHQAIVPGGTLPPTLAGPIVYSHTRPIVYSHTTRGPQSIHTPHEAHSLFTHEAHSLFTHEAHSLIHTHTQHACTFARLKRRLHLR